MLDATRRLPYYSNQLVAIDLAAQAGPASRCRAGKGLTMAQVAVNEAVDQLLAELAEAWNRGDARAYGARFCPDTTITNTDGTVDVGRDEFVRHAEEAFEGILAGTTLSLAVRKLRLVRPDVAVADLDLRISGMPTAPPGTSDGPGREMRTSLMLVLVEEDSRWWITAQHNVVQSAGH
jgi:uncharacterized protein (TIGR02246 family)